MTKKSLLEQFKDYLAYERGYSNLTLTAYLNDLKQAEDFWKNNGGFNGFKQVTSRDIEIYIASLASTGLSQASQARKLSSLKSFYKFLTRRNLVEVDPTQTVSIHRKSKKLPEFFYEPEIKKVLDSLSASDKLTVRNKAMFELFYATGMRVSEVSNLTLEQIDFDVQMILVHGKGNKDRYVPFGDYAKACLLRYLNEVRRLFNPDDDNHYVFLDNRGHQLTSRGIEYIMRKVFQKGGLSANVHPHELRHTFATQMLNNGADLRSVQELLGHESLSTTQIYTHVTMERLQKDYEKFFPRNKGKD
ncbi:tyrosine recombinase XerC [Lactobacillus jensenii]|uniref:tyrosine recombinase XerC n=1 Tax=Lactobacillus jensenii TaxID=109790 RepID=UPI0006F0254D|nr:tyrosine recombinase XerC [Lactobacillus jensenii]KRM50093.1 tyrosine recombinase XerC [Lactobacillus jensenii DSM 20557]MBQ4669964.1 tyrosine recombinase XerC [Lactobacillus jensenii]MBW8449577.1 tyrosine recombinase XerC [Lactobacillus jensenii]